MAYTLGILDQSPVFNGETNEQTLARTVELAILAEKLGYEKFWVSEHHNTPELAGAAPEALIAYLLAKTSTIKIGSGGIMIQHYSPYKVAETFHVLQSLAPSRVELGVGKGPGGLPLSTKALQNGTLQGFEQFEEKFTQLNAYLQDQLPLDHPLYGVHATPLPQTPIDVTLLGASVASAAIAKKHRVNFSFANFFNSDETVLAEAAKVYKENNPTGRFILAVSVVAAETTQQAQHIVDDYKIFKVHLKSGRSVTVKTEEAGHEFARQAGEDYELVAQRPSFIVGTAEEVKTQLDELHKLYDVDEFILHTPVEDPTARMRSFELLSPLTIFEKQSIY